MGVSICTHGPVYAKRYLHVATLVPRGTRGSGERKRRASPTSDISTVLLWHTGPLAIRIYAKMPTL